MRKKYLFKSLVVITGLLLQFNLLAQNAPPIALHVETAGTLPSLIAESKKYEITDLTLTGNLNGTDIRYIREMVGRDYQGNATNGKLANLNLAEANIVEGGGYYYIGYSSNYYYTSSNTIGDNAFRDCTGLTNVTIPNSVTNIGIGAFWGCTSLTEIHCLNPQPIVVSVSASPFSSVNKTIKLYVPKGSYSAYWVAPVWCDFNIIEEDATSTSINTINKDNITIQLISNGIVIDAKEEMFVSVYNFSGQRVYQSVIIGNTEVPLNKGQYIVRVNNESQKIIVR